MNNYKLIINWVSTKLNCISRSTEPFLTRQNPIESPQSLLSIAFYLVKNGLVDREIQNLLVGTQIWPESRFINYNLS